MGKLTVLALRVVLAVVVVGTVFFQVLFATMLFIETTPVPIAVRAPVVAVVILGIGTIQVTIVGVWRLLTMVRRGTVFSHSAFRYVHLIIGAMTAASLLMFTFGVLLATLPLREDVAPGMILMIGGAAVMIAGIALIVLVLRMLLSQAVARDAEARQLRSELKDVI